MDAARSCMNGHPLAEQDQTCPVCGTVPVGDSFVPLPTPVLPTIPGYDVVEEIGHGGMGVVYKARHQKLDRWVAIKMIRNWSFASAEEQSRFQAEAQAVARLQHPQIVQIYEIGEWQGMPYLALEFVEGGTLQARLGGQPMTPLEAARLLRRVVEPMVFAHEKGIVHRDLKPANVLLDGSGQPKITDFGLAKRVDAHTITRPDAILGTPCYMAPEQAQRQKRTVGPAADVYALGVILYEMLTGRPPFLGESALDTIQQVLQDEPVSPRRLHPRVPFDLDTICMKCLRKDPERRYRDAAALADDLAAFLEQRPIKARPISVQEVAWRWCVRNPAPALLSATLVLFFFAAFGIVAWQLSVVRKAYEDLETVNLELKKSSQRELDEVKKREEAVKSREIAINLVGKEQGERKRLSRWQSAQRAWEEGNLALADEHLLNIEIGLRRWEWEFLRNRHRPMLLEQFSNPAGMRACAHFSPDGRFIAFAGRDGALGLYDTRTGGFTDLPFHAEHVNCIAFSPDSSLLAAGDDAKTIVLWDLPTQRRKRVLADLPDKITSLAISSDGQWLAFGWTKGYAVRALASPLEDRAELAWLVDRSELANLAFSPDGRWLATGCRDGRVEMRDLALPKPVPFTLLAHPVNATAVAYSPDGNYLITGGDGSVRIWDASSLQRLRIHEDNLGVVTSIAVSNDSQLIAVGGLDAMIRLWDLDTGLAHAVLRGHAGPITSLDFAARDGRLVSTARDDSVRIWNPRAIEGASFVHSAREAFVSVSASLATPRVVIPEARLERVGSQRLWTHRVWMLDLALQNAPAGKREVTLPLDSDRTIGLVALSADGNRLALTQPPPEGRRDVTRIHVWKSSDAWQSLVKLIDLEAPSTSVTQMLFHPQRPDVLVTAEGDGRVTLWNLAGTAKERILHDPQDRRAETLALAMSPDGKWLAAGGLDRVVRVWNLDKAEDEPSTTIDTAGAIRCLAFAPGNAHLAFWAGEDFSAAPIEIVDCPMHSHRKKLSGHNHSVQGLAFHPKGDRLLSIGADDVLRVWDVETESELMRWKAAGRHSSGARLAFSPDGRYAISAGKHTVCVWNGCPK